MLAPPPPLMALYRLYRGVDARDVARAFSLALTVDFKQFEAFNISGATPLIESDCDALFRDAASVLKLRAPELVAAFQSRNWPLPTSIDRVYVTDKARRQLGFETTFGWREYLQENKL